MREETKMINKSFIMAWTTINAILVGSYWVEVIKGARTVGYAVAFMFVTILPELVSVILYRKKPDSTAFKYVSVIGYLFMYTFVMMSGNTFMVFTYIFPMLSFLILYHKKRLILGLGIVVLIINILFIYMWEHGGIGGRTMIIESRDYEIQIALILLCFSGSYATAQLYDQISRKNREYVQIIDESMHLTQEMTLQSIRTIVNAIDAKDEYTKGHSQRVSQYAYALSIALGMEEAEAQNIRRIGLLHDIGKIGVPDSILNKAGRLTDEEFAVMKTHPSVGATILNEITFLPGLNIGARYHHERYDGRGYPSGLKGDEIPYIAKIIGVADAYDAMSSNRVYRTRLSNTEILEEFERCKGTQFDPKITDVFITLLKEEKLSMAV